MTLRGKMRRLPTIHGEAKVEWYSGFLRDGLFHPCTRWPSEGDARRAARVRREQGDERAAWASRVVYPWDVRQP